MPDIPVWPQCNLSCVFCSNPVSGFRDTQAKYSFSEFRARWKEYRSGRKTYLKFDGRDDFISLTGGEPTIHPDFLRVLALLRRDRPRTRIKLLSNGRMFFYPEFARRCLALAGAPFEVAVPMFGSDAKSHQAIARVPGSFTQTVQGLKNLFRWRLPGQKVEVRVILHRLQMRALGGLLDLLRREFPRLDSLDFLFVEFEGSAERYASRLRMPVGEAARALEAHLPRLRPFRQFRLLHFPLCTVPRRLWPQVWNTLDPIKVAWLPGCARCAVRRHCVGIHRSHLRELGPQEYRPVRGPAPLVASGDPHHPILAVD